VIDVGGPVSVDKSFVVPATGNQPARLVIDVVPTTRQAFLDTAKAWRDKERLAAAAQHERELVVPEKPPGGKLTVVLDPGHGGIDNGTHGATGVYEKDITLAFAKILGEKLRSTGLYDVFYTRTDDSFVALNDRVAFARAHHADLFLSIHANSFSVRSVRGTTIYTVSDQPSDKMVADVASMENQSDALAGIDVDKKDMGDVKDILFDLTQRETRNFGVVFARNLVKELKGSTRMFKVPHQQAAFIVLEAPDIPSAMIELGFVTNKEDEKLLLSDDWRRKTADSVADAIAGYFKTHLAGSP
jgi:N-acetylmuramoyl-L-alanine amidase